MKLGVIPYKAALILRSIGYLRNWGMIEVFMLGILISMIKLAKMATVIPGFASGAFMLLVCILTTMTYGLNPDDVWQRLPFKKNLLYKRAEGKTLLAGCRNCSLLFRAPVSNPLFKCPRCRAQFHFRKTNSISRTWALIIAAAILYFPANLFPITVTRSLVREQADTILSGVMYFLHSGSWFIALVIFIASIIIPLMKLIILGYLLISVQKKSNWKPGDRTRLYRIFEAIGRWSMVDIFVVTILVSLVQLGPVANITAGPGAGYFCAVVVITMFAAESFDPRLIWDAMEESQ